MVRSRDIIRIARRRAGLSQRELARLLGCPPSTVARWETGRAHPSYETLREVGEACGLDLGASLTKLDRSYDGLILDQLTRRPWERLTHVAAPQGFDPLPQLRALEAEELPAVVIGRIAEVLQGSPVGIGERLVEVCAPEEHHQPLRLAVGDRAAELRLHDAPRGTRGYRDLAADAERIALGERGPEIAVASVLDLVRMADADYLARATGRAALDRLLEIRGWHDLDKVLDRHLSPERMPASA